jgi:hypothetical protein
MRQNNHRLEVLLGQSLAACRHPIAAWHRFSIKWRVVTLTAYAAAGYVTTLGLLLVLERV